jgi:hypothetical protein
MTAKRVGKQADDIFAPTTARGTAVTVTLDNDDIEFLDGLAASVKESKGIAPDRAEVIRKVIGIVRSRGLLGKPTSK